MTKIPARYLSIIFRHRSLERVWNFNSNVRTTHGILALAFCLVKAFNWDVGWKKCNPNIYYFVEKMLELFRNSFIKKFFCIDWFIGRIMWIHTFNISYRFDDKFHRLYSWSLAQECEPVQWIEQFLSFLRFFFGCQLVARIIFVTPWSLCL